MEKKSLGNAAVRQMGNAAVRQTKEECQ